MAGTAVAAALITASPATASAQALPPPNDGSIVSVCSGVSLPPSTVTDIVDEVVIGIYDPVEGVVNEILLDLTADNPILGALLPTPLSVDVQGLLDRVAAGDPITLQAIAADGTLIGPTDQCDATADSFRLANEQGVSMGGNRITGLGENGREAVAGEIDSIAIGNDAATDANAIASIAIGTGANIGAGGTGSVALGEGTSVTVANSVALGADSIAARGALTGISVGEVSVGAPGAERQITNVANATEATDAVNLGQLNAVADDVAANTAAIDANGDLIVDLRTDTDANTAAIADNTAAIDANGDLIVDLRTDTDANTSAIADNRTDIDANRADIDANGTAIADVRADTDANTSAIADNRADIDANEAAIADNRADIDANRTDIDANRADIDAQGAALADVRSDTDANTGAIADLRVDTDSNTDAIAELRIDTDVNTDAIADLRVDTDANSDAIAENRADIDANGTAIAGLRTDVDAQGDAIVDLRVDVDAQGDAIAENRTDIDNLSVAVNSGAVGAVRYSDADDPDTPNGGTVTDNVTLVGASGGPVTINNVAAGEVAVGSTQAVNGGQLAQTNADVAEAQATADAALELGQGSVQYSDSSQTEVVLGDGTTPVAVTNLADGSVTAGSTDAVTGGQIYELAFTAVNAVSYDADAEGNRSNTVTLTGGNASAPVRITNLAPAIAPTDAVNLAQLEGMIAASDAVMTARLEALNFDLNQVQSDAYAGTAAAMAQGAMPRSIEPGRTMIGGGFGVYQGEVGFSVGGSYRSTDGGATVNLGITYDSRQNVGAAGGFGFQL